MNSHPNVEQATSYLHVAISHAAPVPTERTERPFVTISREAGAGGSSLAKVLALKLAARDHDSRGWSILDGNLIENLLAASDLPPDLAHYLPEDRVSETRATIGEIVGLHPNLWGIRQKTNEALRRLARKGRVILVGRGGAFATKDMPGGVHVRLVASSEARVRIVAARFKLDQAAAVQRTAELDRARERYVRDAFDAAVGDTAAYHLVINTGRVNLDEAAGMIAELVMAHQPAVA